MAAHRSERGEAMSLPRIGRVIGLTICTVTQRLDAADTGTCRAGIADVGARAAGQTTRETLLVRIATTAIGTNGVLGSAKSNPINRRRNLCEIGRIARQAAQAE